MKKNLSYKTIESVFYQNPEGLVAYQIKKVEFTKNDIKHQARIITYPDVKKKKLISLLTNDFEMNVETIIEIYNKRWDIELLFKQIKQNFPLKCFTEKVQMQ